MIKVAQGHRARQHRQYRLLSEKDSDVWKGHRVKRVSKGSHDQLHSSLSLDEEVVLAPERYLNSLHSNAAASQLVLSNIRPTAADCTWYNDALRSMVTDVCRMPNANGPLIFRKEQTISEEVKTVAGALSFS